MHNFLGYTCHRERIEDHERLWGVPFGTIREDVEEHIPDTEIFYEALFTHFQGSSYIDVLENAVDAAEDGDLAPLLHFFKARQIRWVWLTTGRPLRPVRWEERMYSHQDDAYYGDYCHEVYAPVAEAVVLYLEDRNYEGEVDASGEVIEAYVLVYDANIDAPELIEHYKPKGAPEDEAPTNAPTPAEMELTVWVSAKPTKRLERLIDRHLPAIEKDMRTCGLKGSCTGATARWSKLLATAGFTGAVVVDGVFEDAEGGVGHDWIEVEDNGRTLIIDGAARQFDRTPHRRLYLGGERIPFSKLTSRLRKELFPGAYGSNPKARSPRRNPHRRGPEDPQDRAVWRVIISLSAASIATLIRETGLSEKQVRESLKRIGAKRKVRLSGKEVFNFVGKLKKRST